MVHEHYEMAIRRAIAKHRAETPEQRERIYSAARERLGRLGKSDEEINALNSAMLTVEETFSKPPQKTIRNWTGSLTWVVPIFATGLAVGLGGGYALSNASINTSDVNDAAFAQQHFERAYIEHAELMPAAIDFLREVSDAVVARQRTDRASLEKSQKTFISLAALDAQLAKELPPALPRGTAVIVRANDTDFKVLMNWTLCGVATISNPEMVDMVRNTVSTVGCPYFGLWTAGAATW